MNFSILNATTNKVISISNVRLAGQPTSPNLRIDPLTVPEVVTSRHPPSDYIEDNEKDPDVTEEEPLNDSGSPPKHYMSIIDPSDLVGRSFLIPKGDGQRLRFRIVKAIDGYDRKLQQHSTRLKFICSAKDDTIEDAFT